MPQKPNCSENQASSIVFIPTFEPPNRATEEDYSRVSPKEYPCPDDGK